jgi:hypothetical protein
MFLICSHVGKEILMSVRVEPVPDSVRLKISGDVETVLSVPYEDDDRFMVAFSDGTLLVGSYDDELRVGFEVAREGAAMIRRDGSAVVVDWDVEWATVSAFDANVVEPRAPRPMPLLALLER